MKHFITTFAVLLACIGSTSASNVITNYKCGISISLSGTDGVDYAFERFYHDTLTDDHGVIYLKSATSISFAHNDRNMAEAYAEGCENFVGDQGVIRYKVDRDLQWKYKWSTYGAGDTLPSFGVPFSFDDLEYESGVPVLGATGPKPGVDITDKSEFYYRGLTGPYGDEWHIITVGDDDEFVGGGTVEHRSSDGKIFYFVVNPATPLVFFETAGAAAQYYTTPPKAYFLPKIHEQTTYVTDSVNIQFVNIMTGAAVYYRFDDNAFVEYSGPVSTASLTDGEHTLDYYYDDAYVKTRSIIKNPGYPSDDDAMEGRSYAHGYMLWRTDAEFDSIRARLLSTDPARAVYADMYNRYKTGSNLYPVYQNIIDQGARRGLRTNLGGAFMNALIARVDGYDARIGTDRPTYAEYAKMNLLENHLYLDPIGFELDHNQTDAIPCKEWAYAGYYSTEKVFDNVFAYDALIGTFRSDRYENGITPIEDHLIRDQLAKWALLQTMVMGGLAGIWSEEYVDSMPPPAPIATAENGFYGSHWDHTRMTGAFMAALAMPSYSTPYYGVSGFDGSSNTYEWTPFRDHPVTWKEAYHDVYTTPLYSYPNQIIRYAFLDGRLIKPDGRWNDRPGYYTGRLNGAGFCILANVTKNMTDLTYPYLELSFQHANAGTLRGCKVSTATDTIPRAYALPALVNNRFPDLAARAQANVTDDSDPLCQRLVSEDSKADSAYEVLVNAFRAFPPAGVAVVLYHDDWQEYLPVRNDGIVTAGISPPILAYPNPGSGSVVFPLSGNEDGMTLRIFDETGDVAREIPLSGKTDHTVVSGLGNGMYYFAVGNRTGRFVIVR